MKTPFNQTSYLTQVRRLRNVANAAISQYPVKTKTINFIHHGENATFRIDATSGRKYLLRIHRDGYHTKSAIQEELTWLALLSKKGLPVPNPVTSKRGNFIETIDQPDVPTRNCSVFEWIDGRFIGKSVAPSHLYKVGQILADLQLNTPRSKVVHRRYWTSEGLVGLTPKFGPIDSLAGTRPKQQAIITKARKLVLRKLRLFEQQFPKRQGLIHADLHFGNILSLGEGLGAIDFDDCGYGFHAYDLVIPLLSVEGMLDEKNKKRLPEYKDALISGYKTKRTWDSEDEKIFPYLCTARKLAMLGWLNSRSDNPRLKKHLAGAIKRGLKHLKNKHDIA